MNDLSLFGIESGLHELFDAWQNAETPEQMEAAELAIRACCDAEVRKVDNVRRYWRFLDQMEAAAKHEAATQLARAKLFESRRERLKAVVYEVMDRFGLKKLEGQTGQLLLKGNGGKQAVEITNTAFVPDECCVVEITMPLIQWNEILRRASIQAIELRPGSSFARRPSSSLIAEALARNCEPCRGTGRMYDIDFPDNTDCAHCGGTGKQGVPGARFAERGKHVECK